MSKHSSPALTMRDALYEAPGPKMRAKIRIGTATVSYTHLTLPTKLEV